MNTERAPGATAEIGRVFRRGGATRPRHGAPVIPQRQFGAASDLERAGVLGRDGRLGPARPGASRLNRSGAPIQLCVSTMLDGGAPTARIIVDPFYREARRERSANSLSFALACVRGGDRGGDRGGGRALLRALPADRTGDDAGLLWLALPASGAADAVIYLNARLYGPHPWSAVIRRLDWLLPASADRSRLLADLRERSRPASLALAFARGRLAGIRLYLRAACPSLPERLTATPEFRRNLGLLLGVLGARGAWPATGLTFSLDFPASTGNPCGVKADFCLCPDCVTRAVAPPGLADRLRTLAPRAGPLLDRSSPAIVGIGSGIRGARLNIYFDPCSP